MVAPYWKKPWVCSLLGLEESQGRRCARESCDRDDQGEDEEGQERKVKLRGRLAEHIVFRIVLRLSSGERWVRQRA